jgi:thiamine pyrophosphate-dependent acetolactate synthase large subunit-like protein
VSEVARGFGLEVHDVSTVEEVEAALNAAALTAGPALVRVRVGGRAENVDLHNAIHQAVSRALT